jgi:hypothetical protein
MTDIKILPNWDDLEIHRNKGIIQSALLRYNIFGTNDALVADKKLIETAPAYILGTLKRGASNVTKTAHHGFEGVIEYYRQEETFTFSFDTSGGTQHVTQSYQTLGRYAAQDYTAPNHNGAIGVSDGDVTGCDVIVPQLNFTMSRTNKGIIDINFIKMLAGMTGRINSAAFFSFAAGEVLFEGASGSQRSVEPGEETFDISYKFKASPNVTGLTVGGIQVGFKRGWDYFWVQYLEKEDTQSKTAQKFPFAAYVEAVYQEADLNELL